MSNEKLLEIWKKIFEQHLGREVPNDWMNQSFEMLGMNSFDAITILIDIETQFQINIDDDIIEPEMFVSPESMLEKLKDLLK